MVPIGPTSRIVVGIDGSDASKGALVWAIGQAKLTGATLEAVIAFKRPTGAYGEPAILPGDLDFEGEARRTLGDVIAESLARRRVGDARRLCETRPRRHASDGHAGKEKEGFGFSRSAGRRC